jgi:hypothetical protein
MVASMFNEDFFKEMLNSGSVKGMPNRNVKVGEDWKFDEALSIPMLGDMQMNITYTLKGFEERDGHQCAVLEYAGSMSSDGGEIEAEGMPGMKMSIENGVIKGSIWFDPELGTDIYQTADQSMDLEMNLPGQPGPDGTGTSQTMTSSIKTTTTVSLLEITDLPKAEEAPAEEEATEETPSETTE